MPLVLQTSLGGGVGRLNHEALREEVHRFVENNHTMIAVSFYVFCCNAAMHKVQGLIAYVRTQRRPPHRAGACEAMVYFAVSQRAKRGRRCGCRPG